MYNITPGEVETLLQKLREIRQLSGEMMAFLEHMRQLQDDQLPDEEDPDDYLKPWISSPQIKKG